jgi:hypothetical protein
MKFLPVEAGYVIISFTFLSGRDHTTVNRTVKVFRCIGMYQIIEVRKLFDLYLL